MGFRPSKRVMWIIVSGLAAVAIGAGVAAVVLGDSTSSKRAAEPSTAPSTVASTAASTTTTVAPSWPPPKSIVLAGDSLLSTLAPALKFVAGGRGIEVTDWSSPGCGLIRGLISSPDFTQTLPWSKTCDENIPPHEDGVAALHPDLVVWLSSWESADRIVDGRGYRLGTLDGDAKWLELIDEAVHRLTANGARVVFFTFPPAANSEKLGTPSLADARPGIYLNQILRVYAERHPANTFLVDLSEMVCPGGPPCPTEVNGVVLRPGDGHHFSGDGPGYLAPRLLDAIMAHYA